MGLRYVHAPREGVCVRQQGRLSLVGGGMVKRFGLPSLSHHHGCESQIKLSLSSFLSFFFHSPPPHLSLFHTLVSFLFLYLPGSTLISSHICLFFTSKLPPWPCLLSLLKLDQLRLPIMAHIRHNHGDDCLSE